MSKEIYQEINAILHEARKVIAAAAVPESLDEAKHKYLGKSGALARHMEMLRELEADEKKARGKVLNDVKRTLQDEYDRKKLELESSRPSGPMEDITLPGKPHTMGKRHILMQVMQEITDIFQQMGFELQDGPEIEDEFHNFAALNIGPDHPARGAADNFYLSSNLLLRSQTSPVQIRAMERIQGPVRMIAPGRVYRPDTVDATHHFMFHQVEGLMIDHAVSFTDLKGCLTLFAKRMFGEVVGTRFRPHYFPFTEPSAEMDVTCLICRGKPVHCAVCSGTGWLEVLGCGMVHPKVFQATKYDPKQYTGFAFGMGVERLTMLRYGIQDIRYFLENDIRFLRQF